MTYLINEIFYSVQGEGINTGYPAIFIRFANCNLACPWCDTQFKQSKEMTKDQIRNEVISLIKSTTGKMQHDREVRPLIIFTGGEPALQLDNDLIAYLRDSLHHHYYCIETNGTIDISKLFLDFITVSPKPGSRMVVGKANELKLVYPTILDPHDFEDVDFEHHFIQPLWIDDDPDATRVNQQKAIQFVLENPRWKLSGQLHKFLRMP